MSIEEKAEAVRAEFRPGGRPVQAYFMLGFDQAAFGGDGDELAEARRLTNEIIANFEERLVALETHGQD